MALLGSRREAADKQRNNKICLLIYRLVCLFIMYSCVYLYSINFVY
jgi:hypothetical protein